ncbi:MAG: polysaccharide deacetylase family protein [Lachnospiraceae bacterium]|nr:polysaccharide deacetylase family protein [Lachnospiraceae bacterium]
MTEKEAQEAKRHKRVDRLKKGIMGLFVFAVLAPIVLTVVFTLRINSLEKRLRDVTGNLEKLQAEEQKSAVEAYVSALGNPSGQEGASGQGATAGQEGASGQEATAGQEDARGQEDASDEENVTVRKVYLTFDDGPSSNTDNILDILDTYGVKATFFVTGKEGAKAEASYRRIVEEGHTLGMHSYTHDYSVIYASEEAFMEDMEKLQRYLYDVTGVQSTYIRFPGGSSNKVSDVDMRLLITDVHEAGMEYFDWNVSSQDASSKPLTKEEILDNCLNSIERFQNCIILMHDAGSKDSTVEALPELIEHIQAMEHTELLPITEDTVPVWHIKMTQETED